MQRDMNSTTITGSIHIFLWKFLDNSLVTCCHVVTSDVSAIGTKVQSSGFMPIPTDGNIGTGPQHCYLWESNLHSGDCL